ncbi:MAG: hypothetical protein D6781_12900 [Verrucomicrobia bacterium]|nr:MAG: hypothetical protein D6781_12900 [Verrucomicrobiota bacterium]
MEVVFAVGIFGLCGLGIASAFLQSRRIAESNVFETTALTVAQGFLEQIKAMDYAVIEAAVADPTNNKLPTLGIAHDGLGGTNVVPEPIAVGQKNAVGIFEGTTHRGILIDLQRDKFGKATIPRYMKMWVTPTLTDLLAIENRRCIEVSLLFEWEARDLAGNAVPRQRTVRIVSSNVPTY